MQSYLRFVLSCMLPAIAGESVVIALTLVSSHPSKWTYIAWLSIALGVFILSSIAYFVKIKLKSGVRTEVN